MARHLARQRCVTDSRPGAVRHRCVSAASRGSTFSSDEVVYGLTWPMQADGLNPFDAAFDDHFNVRTELVDEALQGRTPKKATTPAEFATRCAELPDFRLQPQCWGIKVRFLVLFYEFVEADLKGYVATHCLDPDGRTHICMLEPCHWDHGNAAHRFYQGGHLESLEPNMHLVVQRYVKPWTEGRGVGMSLLLNAAHLCRKSATRAEDFCRAKVFISHCWNERFEDFVRTLHQCFDHETVVWVCSFALNQHGDISGALSSLEQCPFAVALTSAERVLAVTDDTAEAFDRCWVVLEADLARKAQILYDISLPEDGDVQLWDRVWGKLEALDVSQCHASRAEDKEAILQYADRGEGGIAALNAEVRQVAHASMQRARVMALVASGDVESLLRMDAGALGAWRSVRGLTALHVAVLRNHVRAAICILGKVGPDFLDVADRDGRTPLSVAAEHGSIGGVEVLLNRRACVSGLRCSNPAGKLTALHYGALCGSAAVVDALARARSELEARCDEKDGASTALMLAARVGNSATIRSLAGLGADLEARTNSDRTALFTAARWGFAESVAALLAARADVESRNMKKLARTPLMAAACNGTLAAASVLLGAGAHVEAVGGDGLTARDLCGQAAASDRSAAEDLRLLLDRFCEIQRERVEQALLEKEFRAKLIKTNAMAIKEMGELRRRERSLERRLLAVQLEGRRRSSVASTLLSTPSHCGTLSGRFADRFGDRFGESRSSLCGRGSPSPRRGSFSPVGRCHTDAVKGPSSMGHARPMDRSSIEKVHSSSPLAAAQPASEFAMDAKRRSSLPTGGREASALAQELLESRSRVVRMNALLTESHKGGDVHFRGDISQYEIVERSDEDGEESSPRPTRGRLGSSSTRTSRPSMAAGEDPGSSGSDRSPRTTDLRATTRLSAMQPRVAPMHRVTQKSLSAPRCSFESTVTSGTSSLGFSASWALDRMSPSPTRSSPSGTPKAAKDSRLATRLLARPGQLDVAVPSPTATRPSVLSSETSSLGFPSGYPPEEPQPDLPEAPVESLPAPAPDAPRAWQTADMRDSVDMRASMGSTDSWEEASEVFLAPRLVLPPRRSALRKDSCSPR